MPHATVGPAKCPPASDGGGEYEYLSMCPKRRAMKGFSEEGAPKNQEKKGAILAENKQSVGNAPARDNSVGSKREGAELASARIPKKRTKSEPTSCSGWTNY